MLAASAGLLLGGCAGTPAAKLGDSIKHGFTAVRVFDQTVFSGFSLATISGPPLTIRLFDFTNRAPLSQLQQQSLTIREGQGK